MIYIHSYGVGKFGNKQIRNIYDTLDEAMAQQRVLGGVVQAFESVENIGIERYHIEQVLLSEVSELIDNMTNHSPGSPWEEPGSTALDCAKVDTINLFSKIINGNFDEIE